MEMRKTLQNTDHLTIRQGEVSEICLLYTACGAAQICSLKYIGLALGIIAVDYVGFTVKADIQFFVISEITQLD